jgi:hypothetical protein
MDNPETHAMLGTERSTKIDKTKSKAKKNFKDYQHGPY